MAIFAKMLVTFLPEHLVTLTLAEKANRVTRCGDLLPFWWCMEVLGNNVMSKIAKKNIYKSFDVDILAFERSCYCGDKFGNFSSNAGDFFSETPGHTISPPSSD